MTAHNEDVDNRSYSPSFSEGEEEEETDDDVVPLVQIARPKTMAKSASPFFVVQKRFIFPLLTISILALLMLFSGGRTTEVDDKAVLKPEHDTTTDLDALVSTPSNVNDQNDEENQVQVGNPDDTNDEQAQTKGTKPIIQSASSVDELLEKFSSSKEAFYRMLMNDYGDNNFDNIFMEEDGTYRGRSALVSPDVDTKMGLDRTKRKITIKILQSLTKDKGIETPISLVWATGGHSAAAGHGNFYNQSYTAYLERGVKDVFASLGIEFVGRNYAVGGAASGPEITLCVESMFGDDFDFLSWDFGMTDGGNPKKMEHYFHRAAMVRSHPVLVALLRGEENERRSVMEDLVDRGAAALFFDDAVLKNALNGVPDTLGNTQAQIDDMPAYVRSFKCDGAIEDGDPFCGEEKFTMSICSERRFRTSWHPGWKWHALNGNLMASFLVELVEDSLKMISSYGTDLSSLLSELMTLESTDYESFTLNDELPKGSTEFQLSSDIIHLLYKEPNYCHIALLPAEIRYNGILMETDPVPDQFSLPKEIEDNVVQQSPNEGASMRLVADSGSRQECPVPLNMDHQDFFYIDWQEDFKVLELPNDREIQQYGNGKNIFGVIVVCYVGCPWGECPPGCADTDGEGAGGISKNQVTIEVNGRVVKESVALDSQCHFLKNEDGLFWKTNAQGKFTFRIKVATEQMFVRYSSFIIW